MTALAGWENFYAIVGSSASAPIGLQSVVITLIANRPVRTNQQQAGGAFATPTVVHYLCSAFLLAGVQCAPGSRGTVLVNILIGSRVSISERSHTLPSVLQRLQVIS